LRGFAGDKIKTAKKQQLCKVFTEGVHISMMQIGGEEGTLMQSLTIHAN